MAEPIFFTNVFAMAFGDNDVQLDFGIERPSGDSKVTKPQVSVVMTPRSAKILAHALLQTIEHFEAQTGTPISMPAGKLEQIRDRLRATVEPREDGGKDEAAN